LAHLPHPCRYFTFRGLYATLFSRLNVLNSKDGHLLHLCKTFEDMLFAQHPVLFLHLLSVGIDPLNVAFPWIHLAFTNVLETEQLLLLWDRLLGYDDLFLLPVLAVAIFLFRSEVLLCTSNPEDVKEIFSNQGRRLRVVPLWQSCLFVDCMKV